MDDDYTILEEYWDRMPKKVELRTEHYLGEVSARMRRNITEDAIKELHRLDTSRKIMIRGM